MYDISTSLFFSGTVFVLLPYIMYMKPIFEFIDYRKFLADYYQSKKETSTYFSYRYFAGKIGVNSPSFLKHVIDGKRNLTRRMAERFSSALELSPKEKLYFRNLVLFNQANTSAEKQEHYAILRSMAGLVKESVLNIDQFDYFAKWYTPVIRELICLYNFKNDYQLIGAMLKPAIEPLEVKTAIDLLQRLKLIEIQDNGMYCQTSSALVAADSSIKSLAVRSFTRAMLDHSKDALESCDKKIRHISGITMGISAEIYDLLEAEIEAFKDRVKIIVNRDTESSRIYQMNISLFPVSEDIKTGIDEKRGKS